MQPLTAAEPAPVEVLRVPVRALLLPGFRKWSQSAAFPRQARLTLLPSGLQIIDWLEDLPPLHIPVSAANLDGFCAWVASAHRPPGGRISCIGREIIIDMSPDEVQTHQRVKDEIGRVVAQLVKEEDLGLFCCDRCLLKTRTAEVATEPDALLVSKAALKSGRVRRAPGKGKPAAGVYLEGAPDWVLEIVSDSSVAKDTRQLRKEYCRAGIAEYWLIDARGDEISFQILNRGKPGYKPAGQRDGWQKSRILRRSFLLTRKRHELGTWLYTLQVKP